MADNFQTPSMNGDTQRMATPNDEQVYTTKVPSPSKEQAGPDALRDSKQLNVESQEELIQDLHAQMLTALDARETWKERQTRWVKQRYGIRPPKTYPWPGCSNLHLPLTDKNIRKLKPIYVALIFSVFPVCTFTPWDASVVDYAEDVDKTYHWVLNNRMKVFEDAVLAIDIMLERGFSIIKVVYGTRYRPVEEVLHLEDIPSEFLSVETQEGLVAWLADKYDYDMMDDDDIKRLDKIVKQIQGGKKLINVQVLETEYDAPMWIVRKPEDVVVPADTTRLKDARIIWDRFKMTGKELRDAVKSNKFEKDVVEYLLEHKPDATNQTGSTSATQSGTEFGSMDDALRSRTGIDVSLAPEDSYSMVEVCLFMDTNDDGIDERVIITYCEQYQKEWVRAKQYNYRHGDWPYNKIFFDLVDFGHYSSRGIPELLHMPQAAMNKSHNDKSDRNTLATALTFLYNPNGYKPSNQRFIPGQHVARRAAGDVEVMQIPDVTFPLEKEEQMMKAYAEEYIGNIDFTQAGPLSGSVNKARTATEIQKADQSGDKTLTLDVQIFQNCMRGVHEQTFALMVQFGPEEYMARLQGEAPVKITRDQLRQKFVIAPNGRLWNSSPMMELAKAENRLARFAGDIWFDQYELRKQYVLKDDPSLVGKILRKKEDVEAEMQAQAAAQQQAMAMKGGKGGGQAGPTPPPATKPEQPKQNLTAQAAGVK